MKKLHRVDEHSALASPQCFNIIHGLITRTVGPTFVAGTMPQLHILRSVRVEASLRGKNKTMLARIPGQFLDDRLDFGVRFFHLSAPLTTEQDPTVAADILPARATIRKAAQVSHFTIHDEDARLSRSNVNCYTR